MSPDRPSHRARRTLSPPVVNGMRYGPHSRHVEALLVALADPAVRRSRRAPIDQSDQYELERTVYHRVRVAGRVEMFDAARFDAGDAAVPSQVQEAAGAAIAIVASDLIDDATWNYYTDTRLGSLIRIPRPGGPLAEHCPCGHQLGQRLLAAKATSKNENWLTGINTACQHLTTSLPTLAALEIAMTLVRDWGSTGWDDLVETARLLGC